MSLVTPATQAVLDVATADDLASGLAKVTALIRRESGALKVEWWLPGDDGTMALVAVAGAGRARCETVWLGRAGAVVLFDGRVSGGVTSTLESIKAIVRRRRAEERLAREAVRLAQRNEALEDFAALVAHELKTPLQEALYAPDPADAVEQALSLVDTLLEAAQGDTHGSGFAATAKCFEQVVRDLPATGVEITSDLPVSLPLPAGALQVILRNLLRNSVAAGARHVHVAAVESPGSWRLYVDDDGAGLDGERYAAGSGLGLGLCRRIAARFGGALELSACPFGGTRATLVVDEAA